MLNNMEGVCLSVNVGQQHHLMIFSRPGRRWRVAPEEGVITPPRTCIVWGAVGGMTVKSEPSNPEFAYDQGLIEFKGASRMDSYVVIKG